MIANRLDANQTAIVGILRNLGISVQLLNAVKKGCPDILVGYGGKNFLFEIKTDTGKLTKPEEKWMGSWKGQVAVVKSAEEIISIINKSIRSKK